MSSFQRVHYSIFKTGHFYFGIIGHYHFWITAFFYKARESAEEIIAAADFLEALSISSSAVIYFPTKNFFATLILSEGYYSGSLNK